MRDKEVWEPITYTREDIIRMYLDEKMSMNAIARKTGMYASGIRVHLLAAGVPIRTGETTRVATKHVFDIEEAIALHESGMNYSDIARKLGVSVNAVRYRLTRYRA